MSSGIASMTGGLVALAAVGGVGVAGASIWRRERDYLPGSLAVALDGPVDPLPVALRLGYAGMEVAVRLDDEGDLRMTAGEPEPLFERAVLAPLAARLTGSTTGRVHRSSRESFQLLLHLVDGDAHEAYGELDELLGEHRRILTRAIGTWVTPGPVRVVLAGPGWPRDTITGQDDRLVFLERQVGPGARVRDPDPAFSSPLVSCSLASLVGWDPREPWSELPAEARHILRSLVRQAHDERRQIRFVDVPDRSRAVRQAFWRELHAAGADYIGSRDLAALARFLRGPLPWAGRPHSHRARPSAYATAQ